MSHELEARRAADPDVGRVYAAEDRQAGGRGGFAQQFGVAHVVVDERGDLRLALGGEQRGGGLLHRIAGAVELGAVAAAPQLVERHAAGRRRPLPVTDFGITT